MKAFSLRLAGCLLGIFALLALEGFITAPTWGAALMLAIYAAAALQCCRAADKLDLAQVHREERAHEHRSRDAA